MNTTMKHYPFPKIRQYHQVLKDLKLRHCYVGKDDAGEPVYDMTRELPVVTFRGTVKLHGTNAAIVFMPDGSFYAQSRENVITEEKDNAGFAHWVHKEGYRLREKLKRNITNGPVIVYGEWCGGSIQKGVAINQLPKQFVVFGMRWFHSDPEYAVVLDTWLDSTELEFPEIGVHNIKSAPIYQIEVDLNRPDKAIELMTEWVDEIDKVCPFAKRFGVEGHGEGIVFRHVNEHGDWRSYDLAFKVKGESHTKSKIRKLPTVDVVKMDGIQQAVETHCHEDRMEQGWNAVVHHPDDAKPEKIADFIRWVINDLWTEEGDALRASDISQREIGAAVSKKAARWFQQKLAVSV